MLIAELSQPAPTAYFHIVSKDKGFDPLIEHMKSRHLRANRHDDFSTLTFSCRPKPLAASDGDLPARVLAHLRKNTKNRPKRRKTLESHLGAFTGHNGAKVDVGRLVQSLVSAGHLNIGERGGVTYTL